MKVKELREQLLKFDDDWEIRLVDETGWGSTYEATEVEGWSFSHFKEPEECVLIS